MGNQELESTVPACALTPPAAAQFSNNGCENCPFLMMAGDSQRVVETTTINYNGMIAVLDPTSSWTAKWLHIGAHRFAKGLPARLFLLAALFAFGRKARLCAALCSQVPWLCACWEQASGCQGAMRCECRPTCRSILR